MSDEPDHVGRILEQWRASAPTSTPSPMGVIGRLHRLAERLDAELRPVFARGRAQRRRLRRAGVAAPRGGAVRADAGELAATTMITSGAVTKRVDRLIAAGRTSTAHVSATTPARGGSGLTDAGASPCVDDLVEQHLANEHRLLDRLHGRERTRSPGCSRRGVGRSTGEVEGYLTKCR